VSEPDWAGAQWFHCWHCGREIEDPFATLWMGSWTGECLCGAGLKKDEPRCASGTRGVSDVECRACHAVVDTDEFVSHWMQHVHEFRSRFGVSPDGPRDVIGAEHGQPPDGQATLGGVAD
jgi:hypothetical protein